MVASDDLAEIYKELGPGKSESVYKKRWEEFISYVGTEEPQEAEFAKYFSHLKNDKKFKSSSLWSVYSILNSYNKRLYGKSLKDSYPRLLLLLKQYQSGYVRKVASTFTLSQLCDFFRLEDPCPKTVLAKALAAIAWSGGLRSEELWALKREDLVSTDQGFRIDLRRCKQRGELRTTDILIPKNLEDHSICFASKVQAYLEETQRQVKEISGKTKLFIGTQGNTGFRNQPMGKRTIQDYGKYVAEKLGLKNPNTFTSHCWRRSAATNAASSSTALDLQRTFGWRQPQTALRYMESTEQQMVKMAENITGSSLVITSEKHVNERKIEADSGDQHGKTYHIKLGDNCTLNFM